MCGEHLNTLWNHREDIEENTMNTTSIQRDFKLIGLSLICTTPH